MLKTDGFLKKVKKHIVLIISVVLICVTASVLCNQLIRASYMYPYAVVGDFSAVKYDYNNEEYKPIDGLPESVDEEYGYILSQGRFEEQSVFELAFTSKTLINVFRYEADVVYLKVTVSPNRLVIFGESEEQVYYFQKN